MEAVAVYLFYVGAEVSEVFEARLVLEEVVAELAPSRLAAEDVEALRELVAREREGEVHDSREIHALLARPPRNPAPQFFVNLLTPLTPMLLDDPPLLDTSPNSASS